MDKPAITINRLRQELDEECEKILDVMVLRDAYEGDAIRFNELFRMTEKLFKMSKPTFHRHLKHLGNKKLVKRKRIGRQGVSLYLNIENPKIAKLRETKKQVDKDTLTSTEKAIDQNWINAPTLLALTFAVFELRRTRTKLEYFLTPEKAKDNVLAVAYQAKRAELMESLILVGAANTLSAIKDPAGKEAMKDKMVEVLDQAIAKLQSGLANIVKKQSARE